MKQGKFLPGILIIGAILVAIFAYYSFAGILTVSQFAPAAINWSSSRDNTFTCNATTDGNEAQLGNMTLWLNLTSSYTLSLNQTNSTTAANNTNYVFTIRNMPEGNYTWSCKAANVSGNETAAATNRTIYVDVSKPHTINLTNNFIINGLNTTLSHIDFNWTAKDNLAVNFLCNLTIGGVGNMTVMVTNDTLANASVAKIPDGNYVWNVTCWDPTNATSNTNTSETRRLTVDTVATENTVSNINNGSWWNSATTNFNWTATNAGTSVLYCNLTVDSVINKSITVTSGVMANYSVQGLSNGLHTWYSNCSTYLGTWNVTGTLSPTVQALWVDTAAPHTINVSGNINGLNTTATTLEFNWTATDNLASNFLCNLTIDGVGNKTIRVASGVLNSTTVTQIPDGNYEWYVKCWDPTNATSNTNTSETRRFTVDNLAPSNIAPNIPNNTNFSSSTVYINWTTKDATSTLVNCSLVIDGVRNLTSLYAASSTGALASQSVAGLIQGQHTWYVNCTDKVGNANRTGTFNDSGYKFRAFYVDLTDPTVAITLGSSSIVVSGTQTISCSATDRGVTGPASFTVQLPNSVYSSDLDGTFTDTSVIGTYTVRCTTTDNVGRTASTSSTFTVGSEVTSASSGGGSSSSSTATASVSTTLSVAPGEENAAKITNSNIPVIEVKLDVTEAASNVKVSVQSLSATPSGTVAPEEKVYRYLEIKKENLDDAKLKSAKISFFVTKAWLAENGLDSSDVELKRYTTQWVSLPTIVKTSDATKVYFEAETPGFSVFAIGVKVAAPAEEEVPEEEAPAEEAAPVEEAPVAPAEAPAKASLTWLYVVIAVVVIAVAVFFFIKKKKK